ALMAFPQSPHVDRDRLSQVYLQRALQLSPDYLPAHVLLLDVQARSRRAVWARQGLETHQIQHSPLVGRAAPAAALPESARFAYLMDDLAYFGGTDDVGRRWDDVATREYVETSMDLSRRFADELLRLAPS